MVHALETLKVLVVDDNAHVRAIARGILKSAGVGEIREAPNGRQALDVLKEWEADLVLRSGELTTLTRDLFIWASVSAHAPRGPR